MMLHPPIFSLALLSLPLLACKAPVDTVVPSYAPPGEVADPGAPFDIEGRFAVRNIISNWVQSSTGGDDVLQSKIVLHNGEWTQLPGGELVMLTSPCLSRVTSDNGYAAFLNPAFYKNTFYERRITLSAEEVGAQVVLERFVQLFGVTLDDPMDPLPTDPDDPRVWDLDEDGNAGYTISIDAFTLVDDPHYHAVSRSDTSMEGIIYSNDRITGTLFGHTEESYLFSSNPAILPTQVLSYPDDDPNRNFFDLVRVDADTTCDDIIANEASLFDF